MADLLFIVLFLSALGVLGAALAAVFRRRYARAVSILRRLVIGAVLYLAVVFAVSCATRPRVLSSGVPKCNGEWCVAVVQASLSPSGRSISVGLRLFSTARRVAMRENGVSVYLLDSRGRRFAPRPDPAAIPFDVLLPPGGSVLAERTFVLPADARGLGLVVRFGGVSGFPGYLVIGENQWFHGPDVLRLD